MTRSTLMRSTLPILLLTSVLTSGAGAQGLGIDPNTHRPSFRLPLEDKPGTDTFRRLPYRNLADEIRIELPADALYDFDKDQVRSSAADYIQQTANLIFDQARGPVRIECRSDRMPAAVGQKLAARCANTLAQWLTVQENLKVKFATTGTSVPPAAANPNNVLPAKPPPRPNGPIVFAKK
jgi:outer membrane protein OmpA-like peptidoglycan-associated protein